MVEKIVDDPKGWKPRHTLRGAELKLVEAIKNSAQRAPTPEKVEFKNAATVSALEEDDMGFGADITPGTYVELRRCVFMMHVFSE